jgi:hypothetical protein
VVGVEAVDGPGVHEDEQDDAMVLPCRANPEPEGKAAERERQGAQSVGEEHPAPRPAAAQIASRMAISRRSAIQ